MPAVCFQRHLFILLVQVNNPCHPGITHRLKETIPGEARADGYYNSILPC